MKNKELIALYFEGQLNADQSKQFEVLMENDADFKSQVMLEEDVKTAIISIKKDKLHQKLKQLEQPKTPSKYVVIAVAASVMIALGLFSLLQPTDTISNDALFAQYFEPYTNIIAPASRGEVAEDTIFKAFRYYDTENYKLASEKFEVLYTQTNTPYYLFYQAISELKLENTDNAIRLLRSHQSYSDKLLHHGNWYLALAYLKKNNLKNAKRILQQIIDKKTYNYKAAKEILKKLN